MKPDQDKGFCEWLEGLEQADLEEILYYNYYLRYVKK